MLLSSFNNGLINRSTIRNNSAARGGGLSLFKTQGQELRNVTVANNGASGDFGGGVALTDIAGDATSLAVNASTIAANNAASNGAGVWLGTPSSGGTIGVTAWPADPADPDSIRIAGIAPWLAVAIDAAGCEHAVLSDGWHHIRLDIEEGRLAGQDAVLLHYRLHGLASAETRLLPLRRLLDLCRHRRFARSLFPRDPRIDRGIALLRVHDALGEGASQREIGAMLFGEERTANDISDSEPATRSS